MKRYLRYIHPAARGFDPNISYDYDEIAKQMKLEEIKTFFKPINFKWEDVENKNLQKNKSIK